MSDVPLARKRRPQGLGRIYRRGRVYWIQYSQRGKKYRESTHSEKESTAVKLLKKRIGEIGRGQVVGVTAEKLTFEKMKEMLVNDYKVKRRKSLARAESSIKQLERRFGFCRAVDITTSKIRSYVAERQADTPTPADATIQKELAALKRMFSLAIEEEILTSRPAFPALTIRNVRQGFFEEPIFDGVLEGLNKDVQPLAVFARITGWRKEEIVSLEWHQVDLDVGWVRLDPDTTKNDEGRAFPIAASGELNDLLVKQRKYTDQVELKQGRIIARVFHRDGKPIRDFRRAWKKACTTAGVPGMLFHDLRRTAVRNLERAGASRSAAMKLTGHKTESVYRRYAIVSEGDLIEAAGKVAALHAHKQERKIIPIEKAGETTKGTKRAQFARSGDRTGKRGFSVTR